MEMVIMKAAAIIACLYIFFRIARYAFEMIGDLLYSWIDPHADSGSIYRDYVNIGKQISKVQNFSDLHKVQRLVDGFTQAADGNQEALHYAKHLQSLIWSNELKLRRTAHQHALN